MEDKSDIISNRNFRGDDKETVEKGLVKKIMVFQNYWVSSV